jgi:hypothetical protein
MQQIDSARRAHVRRGASLAVFALAILAGCSSGSSSTSSAPPTTVASSGGPSTSAEAASSTTAAAATGGGSGTFCDDAKKLADLNAQATKDITGGVDIVAPGYIAKSMSDAVAQLNAMATDAPPAVAPVAREYFTAYVDYAHEISSVNFVMQPTDPAQQKIVLDATKAYAPIATKDLPLLDSGVQSTCGFGLNLAKAGA